jgi:glycogen synthase
MYTIGYDSIITNSEKIAEQSGLNPIIIAPGILEKVFSPTYGKMLPMRYDKTDLSGKEFCSRRLHQQLHIPNDVCIYLTTCLCSHNEGEEYVLNAYRAITETNGYLIIVSENGYYEDSLSYHNNGNILFMRNQTTLAQLAPLMAGADFYLQLCSCESDGVAPLEAAMYGTIPIVSETSELKETLTDCAIVSHNGEEGILEATGLYENKEALS